MFSEQDFSPNWISAPGETIADILQERNLSEIELAQRLGQSLDDVMNLLQGRSPITLDIARRLERVLGASVEFWMSRDYQYRQDIARHNAVQKQWLFELPLSDMIKFGWLIPAPRPSEEVDACLRFFDVPTIEAWRDTYAELQQAVEYRTSPSYDSQPAAAAAWLRRGEIEANEIKCQQWNPQCFEQSMEFIRSLTRKKDPSIFIPELQRCCSKCGVAVVLARAPTGCRASGASWFISSDKAILLLSFRYLREDHFWFTFFHEAGHLLLHDDKGLFLEGFDINFSSIEEDQANEFAARTLVPVEFVKEMLDLPINGREVIRFARKIGISPGIVVGQIQHHTQKYNQLNNLIRRFEWE